MYFSNDSSNDIKANVRYRQTLLIISLPFGGDSVVRLYTRFKRLMSLGASLSQLYTNAIKEFYPGHDPETTCI